MTSPESLHPPTARVVRQLVSQAPADDLAESVALLQGVASGELTEDRVVRIYTPRPTLAMSRSESRLPGFAAAGAAAAERGFTPAVRPTGGRAVAYDESCVVFDVVWRDTTSIDSRGFFESVATALATLLRDVGVDARVGAVAGEYCPGPFSVNARGRVKLIGTSQRAVRGARLISGMLALGDVTQLVDVLVDANYSLHLDWDPRTFGSMRQERPDVGRTVLEDALVAGLILT
ncbi:lipoate--protein ligase family protein [Microbacterium pumilum]|uniref:Biotin/lipoate A/B protein ligase family protein n=1 Tax=Microbacterium pumilum TaxID=344165 RepID=A0ABP5D3U2_9MICO